MSGRWIYFVLAAVLVSSSIHLIPQENTLLWLGAQYLAWAHLGWVVLGIEKGAFRLGRQSAIWFLHPTFDEEETDAYH